MGFLREFFATTFTLVFCHCNYFKIYNTINMKLKQGVTLASVQEKLKKELSSHINVQLRSNPINKNVKWIEANKDSFVGVRIFLKDNELRLGTECRT